MHVLPACNRRKGSESCMPASSHRPFLISIPVLSLSLWWSSWTSVAGATNTSVTTRIKAQAFSWRDWPCYNVWRLKLSSITHKPFEKKMEPPDCHLSDLNLGSLQYIFSPFTVKHTRCRCPTTTPARGWLRPWKVGYYSAAFSCLHPCSFVASLKSEGFHFSPHFIKLLSSLVYSKYPRVMR